MAAAKLLSAPAAARVARVPSILFTVSSIMSYRPTPLPASVRAMAQLCFRPHSADVAMAPYTPREPEDGPSTMHGLLTSKLSGIWTAMVVFLLPVPSSRYARYSLPGMRPSLVVTVPETSTFGPYSVPKPPLAVGSTMAR